MDIQTLLSGLREEVSCPVCSDIFNDPRQLPCLHSFCLKCLKRWHETSQSAARRQDAIICPNCRATHRVPVSGDLNDLPPSFYLNGLVDILAVKQCKKTQITCGNCDKKRSKASYCFQCCLFYCKKCGMAHNKMRSSKDHRVLAVRDFQDKDCEDILKRPAFCPKQRHQKEELKYYCNICKTSVCQICSSLEHSGHALEHIEDEAARQKIAIATLVKTQKENLEAMKHIVSQIDEDCVKVIQQSKDIKANILMFVENLMAVIEAKRKRVFDALEDQTKTSLEKLTTKRSETGNGIRVIESLLEKSDKLLHRGTYAEIIQLRRSLEITSEQVVQTVPVAHDPESIPALVFLQNEKLLENVIREQIGSLELPSQREASQRIADGRGLNEAFAGSEESLHLFTRDCEKTLLYNKNDCAKVTVRDEPGRECVTEVRINDNENGQYDISYSPRELQDSPKARGQILSSGNRNARDKNNGGHSPSPIASQYFSTGQGACSQATLVKPFQFKPVLSFEGSDSPMGRTFCPWGLAVSDTDEIAVTDCLNHRVQIFDASGNYLRAFGSYGTNQGEFICPRGVCFDTNRSILVADSGNNRIQIFSWEGKYMGMFCGEGSPDSQLSNPMGLSLDANGNVIVADSGNKLIKIFSTNGKFVKKIGGPGTFSFPVHCVQCHEYLVVSDTDHHSITLFDREGKYQYKFGRQGVGDGELNFPCCLSVTKSKQLMVCDEGNHRIQFFELNGRFVGKFGTQGSNLGEFRAPQSTSVLRNGSTVVSEWFNHRIQIFECKLPSLASEKGNNTFI